ncbi:hypothetical protein [Kocuria palustris]|uniref:hypothetical protein n=1 Tax=Kocuria palustris TaxID=71999 RepID=UPI000B21FE43|nr:hypothetical protein [Kocuria palustris]
MSSNYDMRMATMFGYKAQREQEKWAKRRKAREERINPLKAMMLSASESMMQFSSRNIDAQLNAAHRVTAQQQFDETHTRNVSARRSSSGRTISETVSYSPKDDRKVLDDDLEF